MNCALWSAEVFEDDDGSLKNVHMAVIRGKQLVGTSKEHFVKLRANLESKMGTQLKDGLCAFVLLCPFLAIFFNTIWSRTD